MRSKHTYSYPDLEEFERHVVERHMIGNEQEASRLKIFSRVTPVGDALIIGNESVLLDT